MHISKDGILFAIIHKTSDWKKGLDFLTPNESFSQVGTWWYEKGKHLKAHKHIRNERESSLTQECVIVMHGSIKASVYDEANVLFHTEILKKGDFMIMLGGGHSYDILEDNTKIIECKNGPFITVEKDKIVFEQ